ncbi:MAG TPA: glycosyltransferase [Kofleriaceae bacterium]|jgi:glycosyltransferase involved in cell wall biosynthesis
MRIAHVTNYWPNEAGHAYYTENLMNGIHVHRPERQYVIGEGNTDAKETDVYRAAPYWSRNEDYVENVLRGLREAKADVAYLQYSDDLFGTDNRFPRLIEAMEKQGTRAIVVTHSVYPASRKMKFEPGGTVVEFDRACGNAASCMHVHTTRMKTELIERGLDASKIAVVAHGSLAMEKRDQAASRRELGIPENAKVVLFFGFIWTGKGVERLQSAFRLVKKRVPNAFLYIGGYTRAKKWGFYVKYLQLRGAMLGISSSSRLSFQYVPKDQVPSVFSAADVVAMPYRQDYASVSGVVHQTAGIGKLMVCSRISKFDEVGEHVSPELLADPDSTEEWANRIERLLVDDKFADEMRTKILKFGEDTSWPNVGKQHAELCERLAAGKPAAG